MSHLFAYGTLMLPEMLLEVTGVARTPSPAVLQGFKRYRVMHEVYPAILPVAGSEVSGRLYAGLSQENLERLDAFEGDLYRRQAVEVQTDQGSVVAYTYVCKEEYSHLVSGEAWELRTFMTSGRNRFRRTFPGWSS